jgi:hypothetical protein
VTVTRSRSSTVPWARFVHGDCACDAQVPCLLHYSDLDWRGRNQALSRAGIRLGVGS